MAAALIKHEQITTTLPKARELRPYVEKLITLAKHGGLSNRRLAHARLLDDAQLAKLFDVAGRALCRSRRRLHPRSSRPVSALRTPRRWRVIELVDRDVSAKGQDSGPVMTEDDYDEALSVRFAPAAAVLISPPSCNWLFPARSHASPLSRRRLRAFPCPRLRPHRLCCRERARACRADRAQISRHPQGSAGRRRSSARRSPIPIAGSRTTCAATRRSLPGSSAKAP